MLEFLVAIRRGQSSSGARYCPREAMDVHIFGHGLEVAKRAGRGGAHEGYVKYDT